MSAKPTDPFVTLYKYTQKGQVQEWSIYVKDDYFWTEEGIQGGTITTSKPTYCKAKNVGRSNATTPATQAFAEAQAKWQKKVDSGYNSVLTKDKKFFEPMLAHEESKYAKLLFTVRTFIQPKLDGLRAISQDNTLASRNGKPYVVPHLYQDKEILDGELYNHEFHDDFNKIVSLCKKQNPDEFELANQVINVEFWVYDLPSQKGKFSERYEALQQLKLPAGYVLVPTFEVKSQKDIDKYHEQFLEDGYEGSILRLDLGDYENKRSKQLLKKKDFIDEEFKIIGAEEGTGGRVGTIGYFVVELEDGKTCKSNVKGDHQYLAEVWKDRKKYIGTKATIKYFNRTPDNSLRFPYVIKLNREAYE
jgi:DNA ligase-1